MITLKYRLTNQPGERSNPLYILTEIVNGEADKIRFELSPKNNLKLSSSGRTFRLKDGICEVKFTDLPDDAIELFVIEGEKRIFLNRILKSDGAIFKLPSDELLYEKLRRENEELYSAVRSCEERIALLEKKINPYPMFKFEQP